MSPELYRTTQEALQLKGLSERTQESYLRSVRQLFDFSQCEPEALTEAQLRSYYLHRRNVSGWAPNTLRISYFAIQFFFTHVLIRPWPTLKLLNAKQPHSLPAVLSTAEVRAILACVSKGRRRTAYVRFASTEGAGKKPRAQRRKNDRK